MKKSFVFILLSLVFILCIFFSACQGNTFEQETQADLRPEPPPEKTFTISAVGDILMHNTLLWAGYQRQSYTYDFSPFFAKIKPYLESSSFVIGNLETTLGEDFQEFGGYPRFNTPAVLAEQLKEAGFDLLTTANNHCLDKGIKGLINTLDYLDRAGLLHVGTARSQEEKETLLFTEIEGIKTAILAYTYGTNGLKPPKGKEYAVNYLEEKQIINDLKRARTEGAQLIILCLHFGEEYHENPNSEQIRLVKTFLNAGADIILGTHPHVLQPAKIYYEREGKPQFVMYSLGNFISDQIGLPRKSSVILNIHFAIDNLSGEPYFKEASFIPIWTRKYEENGKLRFEIIPIEETIQAIKAGEQNNFTLNEIQEMEKAWAHISSFIDIYATSSYN